MIKLFECEKEYIEKNCPFYGVKKVSKAINRGEAIVRNFIKKNNIPTPKRNEKLLSKPPFFDKDFLIFNKRFEKITKELSYWIGFFWADGTINKESRLIIEIVEEDGENLKELFNSIFPFKINKRARHNRKKQMSFSVNDKIISALFKKLGKYPKTNESHEKIMKFLNDKVLQKFFLRGLIDGDGNFYINEEKCYAQFTLASNINQDWTFLEKYLSEYSAKSCKEETCYGKSSVLRITGRNNITNFIKFLEYDNNDIGLKRKVNKAKEILKMYQKNSPKDWKKHVLQFEKDGTFVKEWKSALEASKYFGCTRGAITNCCKGLSKTSIGYKWKYKNEI